MATILLLNDDLLDSSRVVGHGRAVGLTVLPCRDTTALRQALAKEPVCAILDLHNPSLEVTTLVGELRTAGVKKIIGYGSHVDTTRLKAARQAGCDEVLPRSAFFDGLEQQLSAWAS